MFEKQNVINLWQFKEMYLLTYVRSFYQIMSQCDLSRDLELQLMKDVYQCLERLLQTVQLKRLDNNRCVVELCSFVIENICISITNDGKLYQITNYFNELGFGML